MKPACPLYLLAQVSAGLGVIPLLAKCFELVKPVTYWEYSEKTTPIFLF